MTNVKPRTETEVTFGIYKVTNPIGEVYIGQSTNISRRWEEHKNTAGEADHKFYQSIRQYGAGYHRFEVVENLNHIPAADIKNLLNHLELQHFTLYKNQGVPLLNSNTPKGGRYTKKDRYTQLSISQRAELAVEEQEERVKAVLEQELKAKAEKEANILVLENNSLKNSKRIWFWLAILFGCILLFQNGGKHRQEIKHYSEPVYGQSGYAFSVTSNDSLYSKEVAQQIVKDINTVHGEATVHLKNLNK